MFVIIIAVAVTVAVIVASPVIIAVIVTVRLNGNDLIAAPLLPRAGTCQALYH